MKITIDIPVDRCGDEYCQDCGGELTDAEVLIADAECDYKRFCFDLGEYVLNQLKEEASK